MCLASFDLHAFILGPLELLLAVDVLLHSLREEEEPGRTAEEGHGLRLSLDARGVRQEDGNEVREAVGDRIRVQVALLHELPRNEEEDHWTRVHKKPHGPTDDHVHVLLELLLPRDVRQRLHHVLVLASTHRLLERRAAHRGGAVRIRPHRTAARQAPRTTRMVEDV